MDINTKNAIYRLLFILVAGFVVFVLYQLVPDPAVKAAAAVGAVAVIGAAEQLVKPQ